MKQTVRELKEVFMRVIAGVWDGKETKPHPLKRKKKVLSFQWKS